MPAVIDIHHHILPDFFFRETYDDAHPVGGFAPAPWGEARALEFMDDAGIDAACRRTSLFCPCPGFPASSLRCGSADHCFGPAGRPGPDSAPQLPRASPRATSRRCNNPRFATERLETEVLNILSRRLAYAQSTDCGNHYSMRPLLAPNLGGFSMKQAPVSSADQGGLRCGHVGVLNS